MDDIKETVRNSGDKLCRAITSLTIRLCDVSLTELADASKAMDTVLPFLLSKGMMSKVDSVRKASISVVMKLAKVSFVLNSCFGVLYFFSSSIFGLSLERKSRC